MDDYYKMLDEAGRVSASALTMAKKITRPGARLLDIAEGLEDYIKQQGCECTFPVNISVNSDAAHYTPTFNDGAVVREGDVVKVDLGARKRDAITDSAVTMCFSDAHHKMVEACDSALEAALSVAKAGRQVCDIGMAVEKVVKEAGYKPVENLGGHGLAAGELHADVFIPNFDNGDKTELEEGQTVAVEVFITDGKGLVRDGDFLQIFQRISEAKPRSNDFRQISDFISSSYGTYPFAVRWLVKQFNSEFRVKATLSELYRLGALESFPVLVEEEGGIVVQSEVTAVVEGDSCRVVTRRDV